MLRVQVDHPDGLFGLDLTRPRFADQVSEIVAAGMSGENATGGTSQIDPTKEVDIFLGHYGPPTARTSAFVVVTIIGETWPTRTDTVKRRVKSIGDDIAKLLPEWMRSTEGTWAVRVYFLPTLTDGAYEC